MYLIITKSFPPDVGGMQNLMWGLTNELSKSNKTILEYNSSKNNGNVKREYVKNEIEYPIKD